MKTILVVAAAVGVLASGVGFAQSGAEVAKAKCMNCHDMDKKKVGPAFKDLTAKYKDDKGAQANAVEKLKSGKGHMKVAASDEELKAAVGYALSAK